MKKNLYIKVLLLLTLTSCVSMKNKQLSDTSVKNYEQEWAEIETLRVQQLPKSLLPKVEAIYKAALEEKNYEQLLKAVIFQLNCIGLLEENDVGANLIFDNLKYDAEQLPQPAKSIVYSMLGQMYAEYYRQNAWTVNNRTTALIEQQDVRTWDGRKLMEEAVKYYRLSLQDAQTLQDTPIESYRAILTSQDDISYQPTLFDLLSNRALAFYSDGFYTHHLPQQVFVMNNPDFFADAQKFAALEIQTGDTLSFDYLALRTYQELLRFHTAQKNDVAALVIADLHRISYLRDKGRFADNEKLYEEALIRMSKTYQADDQNVRVLMYLADFYRNQGMKWRSTKDESYKSGYSKAFAICEQIEKDYPHLPNKEVKALKGNLLYKEMDITTESVQLPGQPFLALLKFRNLKTVYKTVYPLSEAEAIYYTEHYNDNQLAGFLGTLKGKTWQEQVYLPLVTDYQYYTTEIIMPPLDDGFYLMVFSDAEAGLNAATVYTSLLLQVSPLMAQDRRVEGTTTVLVADRKTGEPVKGAVVTLFNKEKELTTFTSDKNGIATTEKLPINTRVQHYRIISGNKRLLVHDAAYSKTVYSGRESQQAVILTDRSIYRPGQIVYYKAILYKELLDKEKTLVKGKTVPVRFRDTNWQTITEQNLTTNDFGSIDGSFTIPHGLLNGGMTLEVEGYGNSFIRVEEYKRPSFEVKFEPIDGNFTLNSPVKVTATTKALAGYAIDHAKVQYRVVRYNNYRYYYWGLPRTHNAREISSGVLETDENGRVSIEFPALAEDVKDDRLIYIYEVTADVTDINGETRSTSMNVTVANKPLLVSANLPDNIRADEKGRFTVETTNLNGVFTPAKVKVEIMALKSPAGILRSRVWDDAIDILSIPEEEFREKFPFDAYGRELQPEQFDVLEKVAEYTLETADNKKLDLTALNRSGYYKIHLTADNKKGVVTDYVQHFYYASEQPEAIHSMDKWLTVLKNSGEPGEQAEFLIAGGEKKSHVYCELIHRDSVVEAKWITVSMLPVKVSFPVREEHRGGFDIQLGMIQNNRSYTANINVTVPFTNKMLDVKLATFRDRLLPGEHETWTMTVANKKGGTATAEIAASLYDASLDAINPHHWQNPESLYDRFSTNYYYQWNRTSIQRLTPNRTTNLSIPMFGFTTLSYSDINWFDATYQNAFFAMRHTLLRARSFAVSANIVEEEALDVSSVAAEPSMKTVTFHSEDNDAARGGISPVSARTQGKQLPEIDLTAVQTRTNFNETAFFYPKLRTNEKGEVLIEFTMPEALTRWKLLSFAYTQDFKVGSYTNELITQKQVAISANPPRFFRENDVIELSAKVNNLTETDLKGQALLRLYDALTMEPVDAIIQSDKTLPFDVRTGGSAGLRWRLAIPSGLQAVTYKITAQAGTHTDGEERTVPVLTNTMLVTETLPFSIRAGKEKSVTLDKLVNNTSTTLRNHSLTLEFTSAPAWYAVQALPYIMEYPYECAEQTFSRYYANTLATTIVNKTPRIKQIFSQWNMQDSKALVSNLEKNKELKQIMLEETPWVTQAKDESERKKRIGLLFDLNRMSDELNRAFHILQKAQNEDGGFPWFDGNPSNRFITQHLIAGMAHLEKLGAMPDSHAEEIQSIIGKGLSYLDNCIGKDYDELVRQKSNLEKKQLNSIQLHYLYACSFNGHKPDGKSLTAYNYYLQQTARFWTTFSVYEKAVAALVLHRNNQTDKAMAIIRSLKEYAQRTEEMGMYWKDNVAGYFWYQAPIETQAILIEAFHEVAKDTEAVEEMKIWLLRHKQTNDWKTTKATSEAIYALLMTGANLLDESKLLDVEIAGRPLAEVAKETIKPEPGTGYVKTSWQGGDITPQMGRLKVKNPNTKGIAWGGLYWQYFEQLDKITSAETNLRMNKQLFLRILTPKGEELQPITESNPSKAGNSSAHQLKTGDLVRVRMELRADRDYEYVHLKDMRAAGFEPVSTLSGHRYQDGLWYYESVKDASTNFFITHLRKGTYVFEYDLRVSHVGDFSNGITTFRCMYAPEFSAHSEGIRVKVE